MGKTLLLTPGFRFHPTDVELVKFYLKRKVLGKTFSVEAVTELDIYKYDPWHLPGKSCLKSRDLKWYFFCPRERKYSSGTRIKRATEFGYWKTTGKDRPVTYNGEVVGMIKTLVFHRGKAPNGDRTNWVMHEYRLEDKNLSDIKDSYVLCMIFEKNGPGPRNGAQYGAPYNEEDWTDGEEEGITVAAVSSVPSFLVPETGQVAGTSQISPSKDVADSSLFGSSVSEAAGPSSRLPRDNNIEAEMLPALDKNDILLSLYKDMNEDSLMMDESNKAMSYPNQLNEGFVCAGRSDGADVFEGLGDLGNLAGLGEEGFGVSDGFSSGAAFSAGYNDGLFLELMDLCTPLTLTSGNKEARVPFDQFPTAFNGCPNPGDQFPTAVNGCPNQGDQVPTAFNGCPNPGESSHHRGNDVDVWSDWACGLEDRDRFDPCAGTAQNHTQRSATDINYGYQAPNFPGW